MNDEQQPIAADPQVVRDWLTHLYGGCPGFLSICSDKGGWVGQRFTTDETGIKAAVQYVLELDRQRATGVYAQSTTLREHPPVSPDGKKSRGGEDLAYGLTHLWADGDFGTFGHSPGPDDLPAPPDADAVVKVVRGSGLPEPSGWAHTAGGYNPIWQLTENQLLEDEDARARAKEITTGLQAVLAAEAARHGWSWDIGVGNLDRLMKIPGTVNRKKGLARPTAIGPGTGEAFDLADLAAVIVELLPAAREELERAAQEQAERKAQRTGRPIPPPRQERPAGLHSGDGPLDVLADMLTFRDLLEPEGWTFTGQSGEWQHWLRPTAVGDAPSSAYSLKHNDHVAVNWSERSDLPVGSLPPGQKLTVGTLYAHLHYAGNTSEAARDIMRAAAGRAAQGAAGRLPQAILDEVRQRCLVAVPGGSGQAPWESPSDEGGADDTQEAVTLIGKLPATFYEKREILKKIRQYAHSMCCSADVVLYATMARLAGMIDHNVKVDTGVKKPASLNLFVGIIDGSGSSKSTSNEASEDLLEAPDDDHRQFLDGIPIGSGEGIAEAMMGEVDTEDFNQLDKKNQPKIVKVRKQVRHNLYFYIDEGETLIRIAGRDGASLWPSIRSAWQAGTLGQTNATAERRRFIKRGTYSMGLVAGFQPPNALVVLRDNITGTAQRFVWCLATDPDIPMDPVSAPDIDFGHPQNLQAVTLTMPDEIKRKIRTELVLRNSGRLIVDPLDVHANLAKAKLAGLLALLDGSRTAVTVQDWELAEEMWAVSCTLRSAILERASREESAAAQAKREERVEDAVQAHTAVTRADARFEVRARWCVKKIREGVRREQLMEKASSKWRKEVPAGYELALSRGWLVEDDEGRAEVGEGAP
ncbi:hypothetical protein [Streptomyces sp. SM1]|uniref:hypothetical protein n=1 Tax=Streptomyces sp. SM1 TaxID=402229 RepID=UPI000CD55A17|nr:hypothetical protein [Streptomyces sp. SM1]